jgi:tetratricopeptide (TPR) repeat protein
MSYSVLLEHTKSGKLHFKEGKYQDAEKEFKAALEEAEKYQAPNEYLAHQLKTMGLFYFAMGKNEKAESLLTKSIGMENSLYGNGNIRICKSIGHLGLFYHVNKRYPEAEQAYSKVLDILQKAQFNKIPESDSTMYYICRHLLAMVYCVQGRQKEALNFCQSDVSHIQKNLGPGGRDYSMELHSVTLKYCESSKSAETKKGCDWMLHVFTDKVQIEYLGAVVEEKALTLHRQVMTDEMNRIRDELLSRYDDVWRPAEIFRHPV